MSEEKDISFIDFGKKYPTECALDTNQNKNMCMDNTTFDRVKAVAIKKKIDDQDNNVVIDNMKTMYGCKTEACLILKPEIVNEIGSINKVNEVLEKYYKHDGPVRNDVWFSNDDIDGVLAQVCKPIKTFKHITFAMMDFETYKNDLSDTDFIKEYNNGIRTFGVVINDAKHTENGTHWTAVFCDFTKSPFTIEHFNSAGVEPESQIITWSTKLIDTIEKKIPNVIAKFIKISNIKHQNDNSSCGPYSVYYIMSRVHGVSYKAFQRKGVTDEMMWAFRNIIFNDRS
jgi:hypothetical protein